MAYKIKNKKEVSYYKIYNENELISWAKSEGLSYSQSLNFAKFMKRRFPTEKSPAYIEEWITRFKTGNPERYMDSHSLKVYKEIKMLDL